MNKLILITGDLAAGKSTYSKILSERYHINVLNKDTIKEVLCDTVGFADREQNRKLSIAATRLMTFMFSEFARFGQDYILEANFHAAELERLAQEAENKGYEVLTLLFRGNIEILHERYMKRITDENRHPGHLSTCLDDIEAFTEYIKTARKENISGNIIEVNVDDFAYKTDEKLFEQIDNFMNA